MWRVLAERTYRRLFVAQVVALTGTGLATVALGLLAYRLTGAGAGAVLGGVLAARMVVNVAVAPLAGALAARLPRRRLLVGADVVRGLAALALPAVGRVWQVVVLVVLLQAASAVFTPVFQAAIPDVLPDERDYTAALALSRLAYDVEALAAPLLAAALLAVLPAGWLFAGTAAGFAGSALLVLSVAVPAAGAAGRRGVYDDTVRGVRTHLRTPRLRGLLALHLAAAAAGALVIVGTVGFVRGGLGRGAVDVAVALGAFGGGSAVAAAGLPRLLRRYGDRAVLVGGGGLLAGALLGAAAVAAGGGWGWPVLLGVWAVLGAAACPIGAASGRLLRRSAADGDRTAVFAAHFALSHACWLVAYPVAGWLAAGAPVGAALAGCGVLAAAGAAGAAGLWPARDPAVVAHVHRGLPAHDPHLRGAAAHGGGWRHAHVLHIDDRHPRWRAPGRRPASAAAGGRRG
ncbi:MFS transporter [Pilimelia anulata]|uniref:MFS transporter n=1 Tax=Pilimelia anulata TaxID=53371 RepID=A0A8J3F5T0_9ACTN|nr:MFS transporter [Pilimelia anulata]GGJ75033.1 MFS transporter [Pilimelia anulata]